ncbi:hypothetical protein VD0002_g8623 [Verticillium dahliae]|uniref:Uncharacterized protein n=1 Tax=Verticillium dahliae TaxID=27337 RepID=A0AA45AKJ8_VERDA|nr:hypothetical protein BJF96_g6576 [Verticillium dahliae]PNH47145.1 hypothetical protein VD0004_g1133 [Verticillium dahliae]PNH55543.1 hypothetical protein VD0003_g2119 [Verticillium dahliae]PNH58916.1 hypothetical protein VD0002_g8623 [Verticillium dahliae]PNH76790.1 hypothetical protein VD0001_g821 [Verticillium dahliae]
MQGPWILLALAAATMASPAPVKDPRGDICRKFQIWASPQFPGFSPRWAGSAVCYCANNECKVTAGSLIVGKATLNRFGTGTFVMTNGKVKQNDHVERGSIEYTVGVQGPCDPGYLG